ncbi:hypothetical protein CCUS01_07908 [Colletotrichum cuscutae]|uniref:Stress-associated endoplasmic reticulum protein n=1 Tax=Colletotrichum cuscutae TaxID=1209917 RepID=A0AAI9UX28_9PEZI|nr:hypothetical protein CCUS01_07908 [Colletotrichum cuscutae]
MIALRRAAPICGGARIPRITRQRVDRPTALRIPLLRVAQVAFGNVPSSRGQGTSFQGPPLIERRMGFGTPGPEQAMAPPKAPSRNLSLQPASLLFSRHSFDNDPPRTHDQTPRLPLPLPAHYITNQTSKPNNRKDEANHQRIRIGQTTSPQPLHNSSTHTSPQWYATSNTALAAPLHQDQWFLTVSSFAQTPQQRRANAKFAKDNEFRMGKSEDQIKKRTKEAPKSPISPIWLILLGFVVFGGIVFEVLSRMFGF